MWNIIKEYRHYIASLILVIVPVIALNAGGKKTADFHWFDQAAITITAPVQSSIRWTIDTIWNEVETYILLINTQKNNKEILLENRKLLNEIASLQETANENNRLKKIVEFNESLEGKRFVARVIAQDVSPDFRMLRVNKGVSDGIETGMAVVAFEGIVGRIIRAGKHYSDVLTLLDGSSAIDALLQRNRVRGVIEGLGGNSLSIKYLRRTDDVQVGDLIISSGISGLFPKGLSIGKVIGVQKKNYGISQTVEVAPSVDFNRLEEVTIIDPPKLPFDQPIVDATKAQIETKPESKTKSSEKKGKPNAQ